MSSRYTIQHLMPSLAAAVALAGLLSSCPAESTKTDTASQGMNASKSSRPKVDSESEAAPGAGTAAENPVTMTQPQAGMPRSWPLPELGMPLGAKAATQPPAVDARPYVSGGTEWAVHFTYPNTWGAAVEHVETCLRPVGYLKILEPSGDTDPLDPQEAAKNRTSSTGRRAYVSEDNTIYIFLTYRGSPDPHSTNYREDYGLQLVRFEQPQIVRAPNTAVEL